MSNPIEGFISAALISPPTYFALRITGTDKSVAIAQALAASVTLGYTGGLVQVYADPQTGLPSWRVKATNPQGVDQFAHQGDWIVLSENTFDFYTDEQFTATFTIGE